jgi:penicillin-binding protein A
VAAQFAAAWRRGDYAAMYALLSDDARGRTSPQRFAQAYRDAARTLTLVGLDTGHVRARGNRAEVPVTLTTRIFGTMGGILTLRTGARAAGGRGVEWSGALVFPGLRPGERLNRTTRMPPRAAILARDGSFIARGPNRTSHLGPLAAQVAGTIGPAPPDRAAELAERGVPAGARVGLTGLERQFDDRLAGRPGGTLRAGSRVLATSRPVRGSNARTTISPAVERAAWDALGGRYGGIAAVRPRDGQLLGLAGIAYSAPQPPGSTFKIVTLAGLLAHHVVSRRAVFPVRTQALLSGVPLQNANGEACGGTLEQSFAESCNSVFAPLGAKLGRRRLVKTAEAFGFNATPPVPAAKPSTIEPQDLKDDLAVGSAAIGQGRDLATPLQMASVGATIANRGVRVRPRVVREAAKHRRRVIRRGVAAVVTQMMIGVVRGGTGTAAAIPGVTVAGKTGTAELVSGRSSSAASSDAWFVAFAPAERAKLAVAVMLVGAGFGGDSAAPVARQVLEAGL